VTTRLWIVAVTAALVCVLLGAFASAEEEPAAARTGIAAMDWIAGPWRGGNGKSVWETAYTTPEGGMVMSASKEIRGGRAVMFDFEVFREEKGKVILTPFPFGKRSVDFPAVSVDGKGRKAVFANEAHDFPKRFTYEVGEDGKLRITLEGDQGGNDVKMALVFERRK
jgi:uncharacterized protein DUF6265